MSDHRSQRIREQLRQHPNPRSRTAATPLPFSTQLRRMYQPVGTEQPQSADHHAQLARRLAAQRKNRQ